MNFKFIALTLLCALTPSAASAHVSYVLTKDEMASHYGMDMRFLMNAITDPSFILLTFFLLLLGVLFAIKVSHTQWMRQKIAVTCLRTESYHSLIPWILRLSLGISFIGSGLANTLISPILTNYPQFAFIQIVVGFLFLSGFLLFPATLVALALYGFGITQHFALIGNFEILSALLALLIIRKSRPGIDDLLKIPFPSLFHFKKDISPCVIRIGCGITMIFLALTEKFLNPHISELVVLKYRLLHFIPMTQNMWVVSAGSIELLIGLLLVIGYRTRLISAIAFIVLSVSFFYFQEAVYSHVTLFGVLSILFVTGGGYMSVDNRYTHKK